MPLWWTDPVSPKSKGRPKGRGRAKPKGRRRPTPTQASIADRAIRLAAVLGDDSDRLEIEAMMSGLVGDEILDNGHAQTAERDLASELGARLAGGRGSAAYVALQALRLLATERERSTMDGLLATAPGEHPTLRWALGDEPEPRRAWLISDPWDNQQVHVVGYDEPEPHQIAVMTTSTSGLAVWAIELEDPAGPQPWADVLGRPAREVEPADALSRIWDAILQMDLYYPPMWEEDAVAMRALARVRAEPYQQQSVRWEAIDDEERALLIEEFQARSAVDAPDDVVAMLADTFVDFGDGYLDGGVLAWKPGEPERFLTDWVHRKALLPEAAVVAVPDALKAWIEFCLGRKGLAPADIEVVADEVDRTREDYETLRRDQSEQSPQQQLLRYLTDNDVDPDDREAIGEAISAVNASRLARLAAESERDE